MHPHTLMANQEFPVAQNIRRAPSSRANIGKPLVHGANNESDNRMLHNHKLISQRMKSRISSINLQVKDQPADTHPPSQFL